MFPANQLGLTKGTLHFPGWLAILLTAAFGCLTEQALAQDFTQPAPTGEIVQQLGDAPRLHAPPVTPPGSSLWSRLWSSWDRGQTETLLPQAPGLSSSASPAQPQPDETESAIREIRQRVGGVGESFSDLLSPAESQQLFAEALNRVRQEQLPQQPSLQSQPAPRPQLLPEPRPVPIQNHHQPYGYSGSPPVFHQNQPYPANVNPPGGQPVPGGPNHFPQFPAANPYGGASNPHSAAAHPQPQPHIPPQPQPPGPGLPPGLAPASGKETEQAAVRRIARQLDLLAEDLETWKRYTDADALRRSAQELRTSVR